MPALRQEWRVVYVVILVLAWLSTSAYTALRPRRKGVLKSLAFPLGWLAGELPVQGILIDVALTALMAGWGWPQPHWLAWLVWALAAVVAIENSLLIGVHINAERVVRVALAESPRRPLTLPTRGEEVFARGWRRLMQIPIHPRHMQMARNVVYGRDPRQRLDVWRDSRTPMDSPVVVYFHGGAWVSGDKREQGRPLLHEFMARGWIVVSANYRLTPDSPWPAPMIDAIAVMAWVRRSVHAYGGDPNRVIIAGDSAGGQLAALYALTRGQPWISEPANGVAGCVSLYGVLEMTGDESYWHGWGAGMLKFLEQVVVGASSAEQPDVFTDMSPLQRISEDAPPFLVVQGVNDTLVHFEVARAFVDRFRQVAAAPMYYVELPVTQHAFDLSRSPRTSAVVRAAVAFAEQSIQLGDAESSPDKVTTTLHSESSKNVVD